MKYFSLLTPIVTVTAISAAAILSGCGSDITRSRDIYRNEYKFKPAPPKDDTAILPPTPGGQNPAPATPAAPAPAPAPETPAPAAPAPETPAAEAPAPAAPAGEAAAPATEAPATEAPAQ